jgi:uncharacterized membrane protein YgcG
MKLYLRLLLILFVCLYGNDVLAINIPEFSPNIVDPSGALTESEKAELNSDIEVIRSKADIWCAVYITRDLNGASIESVAEQAF